MNVNMTELARKVRNGGGLPIAEKANTSGITPTRFNVVVCPKPAEEKKGSIIIPDSVQEREKHASMEGRIIAVSPLAFTYVREEEWQGAKPVIGQSVLFARYSGLRRHGADGKDYVVLRDEDIVAILED